MRETEMGVLLCKTKKNPETDGYERDRSFPCGSPSILEHSGTAETLLELCVGVFEKSDV